MPISKQFLVSPTLPPEKSETIKNEEILVFVHELAESSVVIGARAWVKNEDYWNARWRILEEIKLKLDENEIEMAYPHLTVQMGKEN